MKLATVRRVCPFTLFLDEGLIKMKEHDKVDIKGIEIYDGGMDSAVEEAICGIKDGAKMVVYTPNAEALCMCLKDKQIKAVFQSASMNLPDGIGVLIAARLLGGRIKHGKLPGVEFGEKIAFEASRCGYSLYLLGGTLGVAEEAARRLKDKYPALNIAGCHDGFSFNDEDIISSINRSCADIVFVCLGMPKQEMWIADHKDSISARLLIGLGGSLDVYSGKTKRAPDVFIKCRLEWLYRVIKEPKLIKRLLGIPNLFFRLAADGFLSKLKKKDD